MALKAVFFDAAGTLFRLKRPVGEIYLEAAQRSKFNTSATSAAAIGEAFIREFRAQPPLAFGHLSEEAGLQAEREWWRDLVSRVFRDLGPFPHFEDFFTDLFAGFATDLHWKPEPGCFELLASLREKGIRLGVISNFDSRLITVLSALDMAWRFDAIVVSGRCLAAKPDPAVFLLACSRIGCIPDEALHIGDSPLEDVQGATNAGLRGVLYDPHDRYPEFEGERIACLVDAVRLLE